MIQYYKGAYSLNLLFKVQGSAVYRSFPPALVSVLLFLLIRLQWRNGDQDSDDLDHPYAVGVLVGSVSFLIIFRANHGYSRYWEACGATHQMMSKFMDATMHMAAYHMQCDHYAQIKPPSFFEYPELNNEYLTRDRERFVYDTQAPTPFDQSMRNLNSSDMSVSPPPSTASFGAKAKREGLRRRAVKKSIEHVVGEDFSVNPIDFDPGLNTFMDSDPTPLTGRRRLDGGWSKLFGEKGGSTYYKRGAKWNEDGKGFASTAGGRTPALFLQELSHLTSLLAAVAMSTLRNDIEGAESPLTIYQPGAPWPEVDPTMMKRDEHPHGDSWRHRFVAMVGADRSAEARTRYNSLRPMPVLGGVSDNEIRLLQLARGPYAKVQLAWFWLSEFVAREHLAGSTGPIGAPIISRVMQFYSDGMVYYNHARKIMQIPFPFPSAQLSVFYLIVVVLAVPFLMDQYANEIWLGSVLTFFTVACLAGLHEVARELEQPFRNVPNDVPLVTFLAQFNEALIVMFAGYHPDLFFDPTRHRDKKSTEAGGRGKGDAEQPTGHEPESGSEQTELTDISQLQALLEEQGREIERLKSLVDGGELKTSGSTIGRVFGLSS
eukprot:CAMPEP_0194033986 /NCGR_PEP_ID=MMETSP0009_2-20130614/6433_1 /TAXON_ID=210454 /ORGANISM="Grammatophora oceanica, Strain CCMP 410" /LENGTH=601 /DNA_ID=CAMNT_0038674721 /DNA_START=104 /DNA_END=1912 /DNA_ORIENTATION=-